MHTQNAGRSFDMVESVWDDARFGNFGTKSPRHPLALLARDNFVRPETSEMRIWKAVAANWRVE